ncbi:PREDICTED: mediator of RNA polymerase II transcription subunit 15a-like isoform X2 [Tarenaya hassleriana]|uniref:mediator of RNA polymerase II transcription subunit 15a-like isoform X2 n=1 Tax=Tarenaya hassleriana TaxID=28532 RepID=UPI00053C3E5C|nr:PREDICTED: mediator of RNA polymerase II transcription subunit 15a-like isoform X2 [Tarenaya hassleriana]
MEASDWRAKMPPDLRRKVLDTVMDKLKGHLPSSGSRDIDHLRQLAVRFEERTYLAASDQMDYLRKISVKMVTLGSKTQNAQSDNLQPRSSAFTNNPSDQVQVMNQGQSFPSSLPANQTPMNQQFSSQNIQSNGNIPGSAGLPHATVPGVVAHDNANIRSPSGARNSCFRTGEGVPSNMLTSSQIQMPGRAQILPQQQQLQPPKSTNYMYQQQMQHRHGNLRPSHMQQQQQQQQQHNQSSGQPIQQTSSVMLQQRPFVQSAAPSRLSSVQQSSIQQDPRSVLRQQHQAQQDQSIRQKPMSMPIPQQKTVPSYEQKQQEEEQFTNQRMIGLETQCSNLTGQEYTLSSQQITQQNNIAILQQQKQAVARQNILQQLLGHQSNASALSPQQQQKISGLLGPESGQSQVPYQQMAMQHTNLVPHNMQQGFRGAGQNVAEKQKQICQLQKAPGNLSDSAGNTGNASGDDWREELYQKINALKETYLPDLTVMLQKFAIKLQQIGSLPQQQIPDSQTEKVRIFKTMLERVIEFITVPRSGVSEMHRDRFSYCEKQIVNLIKNPRPRNPMLQLQQQQPGQLLDSQMHPIHEAATKSMSPLPGHSPSNPSTLNFPPVGIDVESGRDNMTGSPQNVALASFQQNLPGTSRLLHSNLSTMVQSRSSVLEQLQQQQKHIVQNQQQKQLIQQQAMQRQRIIQQQQQQLQMPSPHQANGTEDPRMRRGMNNIQAGLLQKRQLSSLHQSKPVGTQLLLHSSPLLDHRNLPETASKTGTPPQSVGSPFVVPSPITLTRLAPSPMPGDPEKHLSIEAPIPHDSNVKEPQRTGGQATTVQSSSRFAVVKPSPPLLEPSVVERPIDRLIKAFRSSSPKSLAESVGEMGSVIRLMDRISSSAQYDGSRAAVGADLAAMTKSRLQVRNFTKREGMKRSLSPLPSDIASSICDGSNDCDGRLILESDTASSFTKRQKIEPDSALLREIKEINQRFIDTVVHICDGDDNLSRETSIERGEGTVVTCSYVPVALSPAFKALYASRRSLQIQPLRLLIPGNYPDSSPILLDKFPTEASNGYGDLTVKTKSRFILSLRTVAEPMSLKDIAGIWNACARAAVAEFAEGQGGGSFSSKSGPWKSCLISS